jgi:hypothetical protein
MFLLPRTHRSLLFLTDDVKIETSNRFIQTQYCSAALRQTHWLKNIYAKIPIESKRLQREGLQALYALAENREEECFQPLDAGNWEEECLPRILEILT